MLFKVYTSDKLFGFGTTFSIVSKQEVQKEASRLFHHTNETAKAKALLKAALKGQAVLIEDQNQTVEIVPIISIVR